MNAEITRRCRLTRRLFLPAVAMLLGACAAAPGMRMEADPPKVEGVRILAVTPELLSIQARQRTSAGRRESPQTQSLDGYRYRIGPHDILSITVWDHPELTLPAGQFRSAEAAGHLVDERGRIFYPHAGEIEVRGLTVADLRELLARRLSKKIVDPQVDVRVAAFRSQRAYVVGEVGQPGPQPITDMPLTVIEAVNRAGGVTPEADMTNITLSRDGVTYRIDLLALYEQGDVSQNVLLRDDDVLQIPDRNLHKVFVLGDVQRPSSQIIHKGRLTLAEALSDAGGVSRSTSDPSRIYVIRGTPAIPEIYHLDASSPEALILGDQFRLEPRDVVFVETSPVARWNRLITQIVPTARVLNDASDVNFPLFQGGADD